MFLERFPNASQYEIHLFECDPAFQPSLKEFASMAPNRYFHPEAVWIEDKQMTFGIAGSGSSLLPSAQNDKLSNFIVVKAIDLSAWLQTYFFEEDTIIMKMDVEGAEFNITSEMVKKGTYHLVDTLLLECHYWHLTHLFEGISKEDCQELLQNLRDKNWNVIDWASQSEWSSQHGGFQDPYVTT